MIYGDDIKGNFAANNQMNYIEQYYYNYKKLEVVSKAIKSAKFT